MSMPTRFLHPARGQASVFASTDDALPELGDNRVTLGDLLLDGEAGWYGRRRGCLLAMSLEVLTGRTLSGNQAAVDEVGG